MQLNPKEQEMLDGHNGEATRKAMEILAALGTIAFLLFGFFLNTAWHQGRELAKERE